MLFHKPQMNFCLPKAKLNDEVAADLLKVPLIKRMEAAWESGYRLLAKSFNDALDERGFSIRIQSPRPQRGMTFDRAYSQFMDVFGSVRSCWQDVPYLFPLWPFGILPSVDRLRCLEPENEQQDFESLLQYFGERHTRVADWKKHIVHPVNRNAKEWRKLFKKLRNLHSASRSQANNGPRRRGRPLNQIVTERGRFAREYRRRFENAPFSEILEKYMEKYPADYAVNVGNIRLAYDRRTDV